MEENVGDAFKEAEDAAEDFQDDLDEEDVLNNAHNIDGDGGELEGYGVWD